MFVVLLEDTIGGAKVSLFPSLVIGGSNQKVTLDVT